MVPREGIVAITRSSSSRCRVLCVSILQSTAADVRCAANEEGQRRLIWGPVESCHLSPPSIS